MLFVQELCQVIIGWNGTLVGIDFVECLSEHSSQVLEERHVCARKLPIGVAESGHCSFAPNASVPRTSQRPCELRFPADSSVVSAPPSRYRIARRDRVFPLPKADRPSAAVPLDGRR